MEAGHYKYTGSVAFYLTAGRPSRIQLDSIKGGYRSIDITPAGFSSNSEDTIRMVFQLTTN